MKFEMTKPCKNCPFRNDETRITFGSLERAQEIEEEAFHNGFPCHLSAELVEEGDDDYREEGFHQCEDSQHCAGFIIMMIKEGITVWPGAGNNDEDLIEDFIERAGILELLSEPVFENTEDFFEANMNDEDREQME